MTAHTATREQVIARDPGLSATFRSEWTKLTTVRTTYILAGLGFLLSVGMTALIALATGTTWEDWSETDQANFDPVVFGIVGSIFGSCLFIVIGALAFASEYSSGMIRLTFTATPKRGRVLAAKVLVIALFTGILGTVTTVVMYVTGQAVLGAYDMPTVGLGESDALRTVIGMSVTAPFFPILGLALAVLLRSTAGSITSVLVLYFAPSMFGGLLPRWWQDNVLTWTPSYVVDSLTLGHVDSSPYLDEPLAVVGVVAWLTIAIGAAYLALTRRDA